MNDQIKFRQALSVNIEAHDLIKDGKYAEAIDRLIQTLSSFFEYHESHILLIEALWKNGNIEECMSILDRLNTYFPKFHLQHESLRYQYLLAQGDLQQASYLIERIGQQYGLPKFDQLIGKHLLVVQDEITVVHDGDMMMMFALFGCLADRGCDIQFEAPQRFEGVLHSDNRIKIVMQGAGHGSRNKLTYLNLAFYIAEILGHAKHRTRLVARTDYVEKWKRAIPRGSKPLVGLCWHGDVCHADADRFVHLRELAKLTNAGFDAVSLQLKPDARYFDAETHGSLIDMTNEINSWGDTAGIISALDAIVTVDTAIAHLAAGMGKPVHVLLPEYQNFRWRYGEGSLYPEARLYRRGKSDQWGHVVDRVARCIHAEFSDTLNCA